MEISEPVKGLVFLDNEAEDGVAHQPHQQHQQVEDDVPPAAAQVQFILHAVRAGHALFFPDFAHRSLFFHGSLSLKCSYFEFPGLLIAKSLLNSLKRSIAP